MKTYEEMAADALARGQTIRTERKRKHRTLLSVLLPLGAVLLVAVGLWGGGVWTFGDSGDVLEHPPTSTDAPETVISPETHTETRPPSYGAVNYLSATALTDTSVEGVPAKQMGSYSDGAMGAPPAFEFRNGWHHVVARATEEYPGIRETLPAYGSIHTQRYRLFRMQVLDPLESGLAGDFFYLLPAHLAGDLTAYDALLISMTQLPPRTVLRCDGQLTAYDYLFTDAEGHPELGNIIAFSDGVFDESLWQDRSWIYGYQFAKSMLDSGDEYLLVARGSTLEEALARRRLMGISGNPAALRHPDFTDEAAREAYAYLAPFENGIFASSDSPWTGYGCYTATRYIGGCPTNEWVSIHMETEEVTRSPVRFEAADIEGLPNLGLYIEGLDLASLRPQHMEPEKASGARTAMGWYEKTEDGRVFSIVRVAWYYSESGYDEDDHHYYYRGYYDETFILLDKTGDRVVSREELIALIGENPNISQAEYGVAVDLPM